MLKKPLYFPIFHKNLDPWKKTYKKSKALFNKLMPINFDLVVNFTEITRVPLKHKFKMK
jgi:hypothetical protein